MMLDRIALFIGALVFVLGGCSGLRSVDLPPETAIAPSESALWAELFADDEEDWFVLLNQGPSALDWRLRAIDSATESIDLQTFLWTMDTTGALVLDHLVAAAERGVRVRLLVDDTFLLGEDKVLLELHRHPNISYRIFNPYKRRSNGFASRMILNAGEFHRLDHRMHNKAMTVDDRISIIGGRNLADEYYGLHEDMNFRDLELLVGGPIVTEIEQAFDEYWNNPWSVPIDLLTHVQTSPADLAAARQVRDRSVNVHAEDPPERRLQQWQSLKQAAYRGDAELMVDTPPTRNPADEDEAPVQLKEMLKAALDDAQEDVTIISAYLIPSKRAEDLFRQLIARGVEVRILTNSIGSNNHLTAHSAYRNHVNTLLGNGIDVHEVRIDADSRDYYMLNPVSMKALSLHAKALIIDDQQVFIGSPNLDPRSLQLNTEMGLMIDSPSLTAALREAVQTDFDQSNAWALLMDEDGKVLWVSNDETLKAQPATSFMQRIEDWFFRHLPIEDKL